MPNNSFEFEIITPTENFFKNDKVESIIVNTPNGKLGIQAFHEPLVVCVENGKIEVKVTEEWKNFYVENGFMEVQAQNVIMFVNNAMRYEEKDKQEIETEKQLDYEIEQRRKSKIEQTKIRTMINKAIDDLKKEK